MAYFAQLDDASIVLRVLAVNNDTIDNLPFPESEPIGVAFLQSIFGDTTVWKQTSYNASFRKNFAGIWSTYDVTLDAFISQQPFPYCVLDETTCEWICVKPAP